MSTTLRAAITAAWADATGWVLAEWRETFAGVVVANAYRYAGRDWRGTLTVWAGGQVEFDRADGKELSAYERQAVARVRSAVRAIGKVAA